ncbi:hypothetical protein MKW98_015763 [Papaver atlanticum]|uniref:Uncharacterized protein n=1 Tax=Papaver atlanticum TaxID=357466 RepID=A0AAD4SWU3_9MAGN|nr:hypothetical protein MKW98_015763 [Papaver atlanticum]
MVVVLEQLRARDEQGSWLFKCTGSQYIANGMPTDAALKVLVEKMGLPECLDRSSSASDVLACCKLIIWEKYTTSKGCGREYIGKNLVGLRDPPR